MPRPGPATKFDGCSNRYLHQFQRLTEYLEAVQQPVATKGPDTFEYLLETVVVMAVAAVEEYLKSLFSICSMYRSEDCRQFMLTNGSPEEKARAATCNLGDLGRMIEARVSFKNDAKRLTNTFNFLFGFDLWESPNQARLIKDLVRVRNVIVHDGGLPNKQHFEQIDTPGFIVLVNEKTGWCQLALNKNPQVLLQALASAGSLAGRLDLQFKADSKWHYAFEELQRIASPGASDADSED